jgi:hypothetical protein
MKKLGVAAALLILIPALIFATHMYLKNATGRMQGTLAAAQSSAERDDIRSARGSVADFISQWHAQRHIMAMFIRHSELDTVNLSAARLNALLSLDEPEEFMAESASVSEQLEHIWETEKFSLDNVF